MVLQNRLFSEQGKAMLLNGLNMVLNIAEIPAAVQERLRGIVTCQFASTAFNPDISHEMSFAESNATPELQKRAERIAANLKNTPLLKKLLPEYTFDIKVNDGPFDAYADTNGIKDKQVRVELLAGVFNPENWPPHYSKRDIDAAVSVMVAHEVGHHVQESLDPNHDKNEKFINETFETLPQTHALCRGIEAVCDIVSVIAAHQAGYDPLKYASVYTCHRLPENTSHPDIAARKEILSAARDLPAPARTLDCNGRVER